MLRWEKEVWSLDISVGDWTFKKKLYSLVKGMFEFIFAIVLVILIAIFVVNIHGALTDDRVYVKASDGRQYKVRNTNKKHETAEALSRLNAKMTLFIRKIVDNADMDHKAMALRLSKRYDPEALAEG